jgi:hypothetical protein
MQVFAKKMDLENMRKIIKHSLKATNLTPFDPLKIYTLSYFIDLFILFDDL